MAFYTISAPVDSQQKVRRSTFRCFLVPVSGADEARRIVSAHAREYSAATHNCFAYVCGFEREIQYSSDAGEPHGSAGKPILNALLGADLTFVLAIVTRWFGGVKLGVPGLIEAYGNSVALAVEHAEKIPAIRQASFLVSAEYALVDQLTRLAGQLSGSVTGLRWSERAELVLRVPAAESGRAEEFLDGFRQQSRLDYHLEEN